tara:strand:- start:1532 stop:1753 length:222 start_codon:yes stop_codon:yes gene_type:complete
MDLIPITRIKISKEKWLNTPIKYEDDYFVKDILEIICQKTYQWILSKGDLSVDSDYATFKEQLINRFYNQYVT